MLKKAFGLPLRYRRGSASVCKHMDTFLSRARQQAVLGLFQILLAGCGYVGEPQPPSLNIPVPIADLRVEQVGADLMIAFTAPQITTDGVVFARLGGIEATINEDAVAIPSPPSEPGPVHIQAPAARYVSQPVTVRVRVASPKGRFSDWASHPLTLDAPLSVPSHLSAEATAGGVLLRWQSPHKARFRIRRKSGVTEAEVGSVAETRFVDAGARFDEPYFYRVEAFSPLSRSGFTAPAAITPKDTFAPSVPAGLSAVPGIGSIEVAWERSPEPDVAGYRLYRATPTLDWRAAGPRTPAANYSDRDVTSGTLYRYAVAAVDLKGNESARTEPVTATAP